MTPFASPLAGQRFPPPSPFTFTIYVTLPRLDVTVTFYYPPHAGHYRYVDSLDLYVTGIAPFTLLVLLCALPFVTFNLRLPLLQNLVITHTDVTLPRWLRFNARAVRSRCWLPHLRCSLPVIPRYVYPFVTLWLVVVR